MKKIIGILILVVLIVSCNSGTLKKETESYKIEISKASYSNKKFVNEIRAAVLKINAEKISLKDLFGAILETDSKNIKFNSNLNLNQYYKVKITQKKEGKTVRKEILDYVLEKFNLNLTSEKLKYELFKIGIQDSLKLNNFISKSKDSVSKIIFIKDTIKVKNITLKGIAKFLSETYNEDFINENDSLKIDYKWNRTDIKNLILKLKADLGVSFSKKEGHKLIYMLEDFEN